MALHVLVIYKIDLEKLRMYVSHRNGRYFYGVRYFFPIKKNDRRSKEKKVLTDTTLSPTYK